uniref:Uncharacterized protein n=1 Tax=viral metagenome TaxID=1070528 RepID=A0A6C0I1P6_9ZZZZ
MCLGKIFSIINDYKLLQMHIFFNCIFKININITNNYGKI